MLCNRTIVDPKAFGTAGKLLNGLTWTDEELTDVISSLECVIEWLEGAAYSRRIIRPLRQELAQFEGFCGARNEGS